MSGTCSGTIQEGNWCRPTCNGTNVRVTGSTSVFVRGLRAPARAVLRFVSCISLPLLVFALFRGKGVVL